MEILNIIVLCIIIHFVGIFILGKGIYDWEKGFIYFGLILVTLSAFPIYIFTFFYGDKYFDTEFFIIFFICCVLFIVGFIFIIVGNSDYDDKGMFRGLILIVIPSLFILLVFVDIKDKYAESQENSIVSNYNSSNDVEFNNIVIDNDAWVEYGNFPIEINDDTKIYYDENSEKYYFEFNSNAYIISFATYEDYFEICDIDEMMDVPFIEIYKVNVKHFNGTDVYQTINYFYKIFIDKNTYEKLIKKY